MRKWPVSILVSVLLLVTACKKEISWRELTFEKRDYSKTLVEASLPSELWEKITGLLKGGEGHAKQEGGGHEGGEGNKEDTGGGSAIDSVFTPVKVYLIEKNRGILKQGPTEIDLGPGGGEIDLADFVSSKNGSFYFAVDFLREVEKIERKVYFLSNSPERLLKTARGESKAGGGCESYFDISKAFQKAVDADGFLINTTDARHVSALVGTYFFAAVNDGKLHLAALTVKDSRYPKLHCR